MKTSARAAHLGQSEAVTLAPPLPAYHELHWPTLTAVRSLGGSASIDEIVEAVIAQEQLTDEQQEVLHGDGPRTEIEYRLAWARTYLKGMGLLDNSRRGVWSLTDEGRVVRQEQLPEIHRKFVAAYREERRQKRVSRLVASSAQEGPGDEQGEDEDPPWQEKLLDALMAMPPDAFERLAQRLLREAGFISATVTGRTGDGGIDGLGVYRMSLVSFPVFFQCKRYRERRLRGRARFPRGHGRQGRQGAPHHYRYVHGRCQGRSNKGRRASR
jgi:restriction system protein